MRLILARHGETEWNRQRRVQGLSDNDLNDTGIQQAEALAQDLISENVNAVYTSPLMRARHTAEIIARSHRVEPIILQGLRELDVGDADGLTYEEMKSRYGSFLSEWIKDCSSAILPGGHTLYELQNQTWTAVQEILSRQRAKMTKNGKPRGITVAVTHYFPILAILSKALHIELPKCRRITLDLASITVLDFNPAEPELLLLNETCHLKRGA